jgi:hypothetical protein
MMELLPDRREVGVDVGMIEFEVGHDQMPRAVMDEFRALVEECRVVFVRLDYERGIWS